MSVSVCCKLCFKYLHIKKTIWKINLAQMCDSFTLETMKSLLSCVTSIKRLGVEETRCLSSFTAVPQHSSYGTACVQKHVSRTNV